MESKSIFRMEYNRACRLLGMKQWINSDDEERGDNVLHGWHLLAKQKVTFAINRIPVPWEPGAKMESMGSQQKGVIVQYVETREFLFYDFYCLSVIINYN